MRFLTSFVLLAILAFLPSAVANVEYDGSYTRWDFQGPAYWGNLTWSGTSGGIAWGPDPPSEDDAPADPGNTDVYYADDWAGEYMVPARVVQPRVFTFTSAPVEVPLFLNATRHLQLELVLTDPEGDKPCSEQWDSYISDPALEARLTWGDRIVAGGLATDYVYYTVQWYYFDQGGMAPQSPAGYTTCRLALGIETDYLPIGAVLKLEITFHQQARPYSFGLAGDHRSTIKFPLYPPDDAVFRYPELQVEEEEGEEPQAGPATNLGLRASDAGAGLGALVAGSALALRPRRSMLALVALLLLSASFAGCFGSKSDGATAQSEELRGRIDVTQVRDGTGGGLGSIMGRVHDDIHIPLGGVHVSLLGLTNFTDTDSRGRFSFLGLVPGIYKLRFDKKEYQGYETEVEVKAGFTARPDITLYPVGYKGRDFRPHDHDYWPAGKDSKEIMNVPLPVRCDGSGQTSCHLPESFVIPPKPDDLATVIPGTRYVRVTLDWDPAATGFSRLGLGVLHNGDPLLFDYNWATWGANRSMYAPRGPNEPFNIATSWEMADPGHQGASTWRFYPYVGDVFFRDGYAPGYSKSWDPQYRPQVTVKITVLKGQIPLEAPHPDRWQGKTEMAVMKNQQNDYWGWETCFYPKAVSDNAIVRCPRGYMTYWLPVKIIPYGATSMEVKVVFNRDIAFPVKLLYKPANVPFPYDYESTDGFKDGGLGSGSGTTYTWKVNLLPGEADPEYAVRSLWELRVVSPDHDAAWLDYMTSVSNLGQVHKYLDPTMTLTAYRQP